MADSVAHGLTVARVALHLPLHAALHPEPWRRQVRSALRRASLQMTLPPRVILVVRRLSDPQPGALLGQQGALAISAWEREARDRLYRLWRAAVRPAYEAVPPTAEAVWFADEAEWLACLSRDLHHGVAGSRWWWQQWLRPARPHGVAALFPAWQAHARWLPQSLALLQEMEGGGVRQLLLRLTPAETVRIRALVGDSYGLPPVHEAQVVIAALEATLPAPLRTAVTGLPLETEALMTLCLSIVATPVAVERYRRTTSRARPGGAAEGAGTERERGERSAWGADRPAAAVPAAATPSRSPQAQEPAARGETPPTPATPRARPLAAAIEATTAPLASPLLPTAATQTGHVGDEQGPLAPAATPNTGATLVSGEGQGLATEVGGIWYLVNALAALDWLSAEEAVSGWTKLAVVARALLAETAADGVVADDPVWPLLADLAAGDPPFVASSSVPAGDPEAAASRSTIPWETPAATAWLARALAPVHAFLAQRLQGTEDGGAILRAPARLYVSRTHVDLFFTLEQIRLDVRRAGLDQDPGWVPQLARIITFHYE